MFDLDIQIDLFGFVSTSSEIQGLMNKIKIKYTMLNPKNGPLKLYK